MKKIAILGANGHGRVVADTAQCCGWELITFFDDAWPSINTNAIWEVVGGTQDLLARLSEFSVVIVAIGNNKIRQEKQLILSAAHANIATLIHPQAVVSRHAKIGIGSVVFAGAIVNAFANVGESAILNTGCIVEHDCVLGSAVHIKIGRAHV